MIKFTNPPPLPPHLAHLSFLRPKFFVIQGPLPEDSSRENRAQQGKKKEI